MKLIRYLSFISLLLHLFKNEVFALTITPSGGSGITGQSFQIRISDHVGDQYECFIDVNGVSGSACSSLSNATWSISDLSTSTKNIKNVRRNSLPTSDLKETIEIECCDTSASSPVSLNKSSYSVSFSAYPVNFSATTNTSERTYDSFGYVDIAPCPCNLNPGQCDHGCCCDSDCTGQVNLTDCISGIFGGNFTQTNALSCSYSSVINQEDYHVLMCVFYENNAIIGNLYSMQNAKKDDSSFNTKLNSINDKSGLVVSASSLYPRASTLSLGYKMGEILHTTRGGFALPTGKNGGSCEDDQMVQYLVDVSTACTFAVSASVFSGEAYQLKMKGSRSSESAVAPTQSCTGVSTDCTGSNIVSVAYRMVVSGSVVSDYTVSIEMANTPPTGGTKFSVQFDYGPDASLINKTSGLLGYEMGLPLLSGLKVTNADGSFNTITRTTSVGLLKPKIDATCESGSVSQEILFGRNYLSSCRYQITLSEVRNCSQLFTTLRDFITAPISTNAVLGLYGNPDSNVEGDWVNINREDISKVENTLVFSSLNQIVLYQIPLCINIITGTNLAIFYAEQGRARNKPIYQIVGAFLKYTMSNISITCVSTDPQGNCDSDNSIRTINIANSVTFQKVPANWKTAQQPSFTACWNSVCWNRAFIIFDRDYVPDSQRRYHIGMGLALLVLAIFILTITHPWW